MLEFLGRLDQQAKIRGFRIEPGEIEAAFASHPAVSGSAAIVWEAAPGDKRLAAFVVPAAGTEPAPAELRVFLKGRVPDYMVPAVIEVIRELPLDRNGKVNRRALPRPRGEPQAGNAPLVLPRSPTEELLAEIWKEVLRREEVGVHDDFFALGGHSLLATQVVSRARQAFQVDLPMRSIFESPTLAGLAERIEATRRAPSGLRPPPIVPVPRKARD